MNLTYIRHGRLRRLGFMGAVHLENYNILMLFKSLKIL